MPYRMKRKRSGHYKKPSAKSLPENVTIPEGTGSSKKDHGRSIEVKKKD